MVPKMVIGNHSLYSSTFHYATNYEFLNNRPKINRQQRANQLVLAQEGNQVYNEVCGI